MKRSGPSSQSDLQAQETNRAQEVPCVSVIIPMRNEEKYIGACLGSIVAQDYRGALEVLVVDGMSTDKSREIVSRFVQTYPFIHLLENPQHITPVAMNIGISHADGDFIVRVDGHTVLEPDYVRQCIATLQQTGAGNVGGVQRAVGASYLGQAIALTTSSPLAVGDAKFRYAEKSAYVDTVYLGAFPKDIFDDVGLYDESLGRNQDYELNYRLRLNGYKIFLSPEIKSWYVNRSTLKTFWQQYFQYGWWKVEMLSRNPASARWRQLAPPTFVLGLLASGLGGRLFRPLILVFRLILGVYGALAILFTFLTARRHGWKYLPILPVTFVSMHLSWGLGFLWGLVRRPQVAGDEGAPECGEPLHA